MMGLICKTLVRAECDRCGMPSECVTEKTDDARKGAEKEGFVFSNWMLDGKCPRQTCFCQKCVLELADIEAKKRRD
jgi:hypothetical protein